MRFGEERGVTLFFSLHFFRFFLHFSIFPFHFFKFTCLTFSIVLPFFVFLHFSFFCFRFFSFFFVRFFSFLNFFFTFFAFFFFLHCLHFFIFHIFLFLYFSLIFFVFLCFSIFSIFCDLVGPYGRRPTLTDGARSSKSVTSSHENRAGSARDRTDRRERKGEMGARDNGERRKQHLTRCLSLSNHIQQQQQQQQQRQRQSRRRGFSDVNEKDFALVQLCKLQSFGEGSSQEHHSLLLG